MKTIEQRAKEYSKRASKDEKQQLLSAQDFIHGFIEATRWIPVEEELPGERMYVLVKMKYNFFNTDIPAVDCCYRVGDIWKNSLRPMHSNAMVTHWRPIEFE